MHHLGIAGSIAALCQGDQALGLPTHCQGFGARGLNALVLKQLLDQIAPQSDPLILAYGLIYIQILYVALLTTPLRFRFHP